MKLTPFPVKKSEELLSWVKTDGDRQFWSGNTFKEGLNLEIFTKHLKRKDLFSYSYLDKNHNLIAYGEMVKNNSEQAVLCRVIVKPDERRKGIGKSFVNNLTECIFTKHKLTKITLNALGNNIPARKCYSSLGYKIIAVNRNFRWVSNKWCDLIIMEKNILGSS